MLCLVTQPDGYILDVTLSPKARGQECLDQVCNKLKIIEVDYFGLQYETKNGELYWLNLRNPIRQQSDSSTIRLFFKVKFYVPPYLIQQQSTRHQFFLTIQSSIRQHQFKISDKLKQAKLIALIAQAELGNYRSDSYDLKQLYSEWILVFDSGATEQPPQQPVEGGKHKRRKHNSGTSLDENDGEEAAKLEARSTSAPNLSLASISQLSPAHAPLYQSIVEMHQQFLDYLPSKAENSFLEEMSEFEDIGIEYFTNCQIEGENNDRCKIGVGTRGVTIKQTDKKLINYSSLVKVRTSTHYFHLKYIDESDGKVKEKKFRLTSSKSANSLYRSVTEKHVFYSCNSVTDSVATQCILGLTGMLWSIVPFKDDPEVGKNFVFDIRRTLRQFYDDVQRTMFKLKAHLDCSLALKPGSSACDSPTSECELSLLSNDAQVSSLQQIDEKLLCRICFDHQLAVAFRPCGHCTCEQCSTDCDTCPICRALIDGKLKIFL